MVEMVIKGEKEEKDEPAIITQQFTLFRKLKLPHYVCYHTKRNVPASNIDKKPY